MTVLPPDISSAYEQGPLGPKLKLVEAIRLLKQVHLTYDGSTDEQWQLAADKIWEALPTLSPEDGDMLFDAKKDIPNYLLFEEPARFALAAMEQIRPLDYPNDQCTVAAVDLAAQLLHHHTPTVRSDALRFLAERMNTVPEAADAVHHRLGRGIIGQMRLWAVWSGIAQV